MDAVKNCCMKNADPTREDAIDTIQANKAFGWMALNDEDKIKVQAIVAILEKQTIAKANVMLEVCKDLLIQIRIPNNTRIEF